MPKQVVSTIYSINPYSGIRTIELALSLPFKLTGIQIQYKNNFYRYRYLS